MARQIGGTGGVDHAQKAQWVGNQRLVPDGSKPQYAVEPLLNQIDLAIRTRHLQLQPGVSRHEIRQRRHDRDACQLARQIDPYAKAWNARRKQPGQHRGPLTRATGEVLEALLYGFHNAHTGACFPSYEANAARAECCRDTVRIAIAALELARVITWANRIVRERVPSQDPLTGRRVLRWRIRASSNAYTFHDPVAKMAETRAVSSKAENPPGTLNQTFLRPCWRSRPVETVPLGDRMEALAVLAEVGSARARALGLA